MYIETNRLIIRDFVPTDVQALHDIKYDKEILFQCPELVKRNATMQDLGEYITYCISVADKNNFEKELLFPIVLKENNAVIGLFSVSTLEYLYEIQVGWFVRSEYTGKGYASETGKAGSDYLLEKLNLDYLAVILAADNRSSFRVAINSGFKLFEKRTPYDYFYGKDIDHANFDAVSKYLDEKQKNVPANYFYFRKFKKNSPTKAKFYGDTKYEGRLAN